MKNKEFSLDGGTIVFIGFLSRLQAQLRQTFVNQS